MAASQQKTHLYKHDKMFDDETPRLCRVLSLCSFVWFGAMTFSAKYFSMTALCNLENQIVVLRAALWSYSAVWGVVSSTVVLSPRSARPLMNMNGPVQLIANPPHVHPHCPPSKSTSVSAVTQSYPRQPRKRLWRSNQLWLNTECDGSHYSKSVTATALTTIDYRNIAAEASMPTWLRLSQERGCGSSSSSLLILPLICDDQDNISEEMSLCCYFSIFSSLQPFPRATVLCTENRTIRLHIVYPAHTLL